LISTSAARFCAASDTRVSDSGIEIAAAMPVVAGVAGASEAFAMRGLASQPSCLQPQDQVLR